MVSHIQLGYLIISKFPFLRNILVFVYRKLFYKPKFSGWGLETIHHIPWESLDESSSFIQCIDFMKNGFSWSKDQKPINSNDIDQLGWRHWIISFCIRYVTKFEKIDQYTIVECGVGDGKSALVAMYELENYSPNFIMHLYDSWGSMREEDLLQTEKSKIGSYKDLDIEVTRKNLRKFSNRTIFHNGYIPDSFFTEPKSPETVNYIHIDLNAAKITLEALNFFYPKLSKHAIIIFDDYGWSGYDDTRKIINDFLEGKKGILMQLPTGQAIYFHR